MKKLDMDLLTEKYTSVWYDKNFNYAPHSFEVRDTLDFDCIQKVNFQDGGCEDVGVNGVANEDLIAMVICRLEHFNNSDFSCRENEIAKTKLEEALLWLRKRTINRNKRGVLGTNTP